MLTPSDRELAQCCGSTRWAREMAARRPFATPEDMFKAADDVWWSLGPDDWREAFAAHPRIGDSQRRPVLDTREGHGPSASGVGVPRSRLRRFGGLRRSSQASPASEGEGPRAIEEQAAREQSGMASADPEVRDRLARGNRDYESRFGYIFIVCATGKSATEMLAILEGRLANAPADELRVAAEEQRRITRLRLERLVQ